MTSNSLSRATVASVAVVLTFSRRARRTGRATSPTRNGTMKEIMNPMNMVDVRLYIPIPFLTGAMRTRQRQARNRYATRLTKTLAVIREGLAPRRLRTASRKSNPRAKKTMHTTVSRRLMPTLRAGFTALGGPKRAALSAREAGTPVAARRAKRAEYTGSRRTMSRRGNWAALEIPVQAGDGKLPQPEPFRSVDANAAIGPWQVLKVVDTADVVVAVEVGHVQVERERAAAEPEAPRHFQVEPVVRRVAEAIARPEDRPDGERAVRVLHLLRPDIGRGPAGVIAPRETDLPGFAAPVVEADVEGVPLVPAARHPRALDLILGRGERVGCPPAQRAPSIAAQLDLDPARTGALGSDPHPVPLGLREKLERVEQVLVAWAQVGHVLDVGGHAQPCAVREEMLEIDLPVLGTLRGKKVRHAVFDLQLVDPLRLMEASPPGAEERALSQGPDEVGARAGLGLAGQGLPITPHADFERQRRQNPEPAGDVGADLRPRGVEDQVPIGHGNSGGAGERIGPLHVAAVDVLRFEPPGVEPPLQGRAFSGGEDPVLLERSGAEGAGIVDPGEFFRGVGGGAVPVPTDPIARDQGLRVEPLGPRCRHGDPGIPVVVARPDAAVPAFGPVAQGVLGGKEMGRKDRATRQADLHLAEKIVVGRIDAIPAQFDGVDDGVRAPGSGRDQPAPSAVAQSPFGKNARVDQAQAEGGAPAVGWFGGRQVDDTARPIAVLRGEDSGQHVHAVDGPRVDDAGKGEKVLEMKRLVDCESALNYERLVRLAAPYAELRRSVRRGDPRQPGHLPTRIVANRRQPLEILASKGGHRLRLAARGCADPQPLPQGRDRRHRLVGLAGAAVSRHCGPHDENRPRGSVSGFESESREELTEDLARSGDRRLGLDHHVRAHEVAAEDQVEAAGPEVLQGLDERAVGVATRSSNSGGRWARGGVRRGTPQRGCCREQKHDRKGRPQPPLGRVTLHRGAR